MNKFQKWNSCSNYIIGIHLFLKSKFLFLYAKFNSLKILLTHQISAYHHWSCEFESRSGEVHKVALCDKVCQWLVAGLSCLCFSLGSGTLFFSSCNNVAPVTNLCLGRATTRSHSSQWSKRKVAIET